MNKIATRLSGVCLSIALPLAYLTLSSSSNGASAIGQSASGCSCHGSNSTATGLTVTGIPTTGWVPGTAYTLTATVMNTSMSRAGFDLSVNIGTLSGAPAGAALNGTQEIYHTSPKVMTGSAASWTFTWTAPGSGSTPLAISFAGNAVNFNGQSSGDVPNQTTLNYNAASPAATAPTATTGSASGITATSAVLAGTINANNGSTAVTFEYGTTMSLGSSVAATPSPVTGSTATAVSASLSNLQANTTYHYAVKGVNAAGTTMGSHGTFKTLAASTTPTVAIITPVTGLSSTGATVRAAVNANGTTTTVAVSYGLTKSYTSTASNVTPASVSGTANTNVSAALSGLQANKKYYYRFVATSSAGTTTQNDSFTTGSLSVATVEAAAVKLFPNPAGATLHVELSAAGNGAAFEIFNLLGQRQDIAVSRLGNGKFACDIAQLPAGGYWLVVLDGSGRTAAAFRKQ